MHVVVSPKTPTDDATVAASAVDPRGSQLAYSSFEFRFALQRANDLSQLAHYRHRRSNQTCRRGVSRSSDSEPQRDNLQNGRAPAPPANCS